MTNYALALLKPDCLKRNLTEEVIQIIQASGLTIATQKLVCLSQNDINVIYGHLKGRSCFAEFSRFMMSGPCLALIFEGDNAIQRIRKLVGYQEPQQADPASIRGRYGINRRENIIHASVNYQAFVKEKALFFK